jgi:hypothetical protein
LGLHDGFHRNLGHLELAARVVFRGGQRDEAGGLAARDLDGAAGVGVEAAGERQHFEQGLGAADLQDPRGFDRSENGNGLAAELRNEYSDGGVLENGVEALG